MVVIKRIKEILRRAPITIKEQKAKGDADE